MNEFDIPIFKKTYELYKEFYICLQNFPRQHRYSLGQKCESLILEILELILHASQMIKSEKLPQLSRASVKINLLRVHLRLAEDIKALDKKHYLALQERLDEIGRMIGGWIKTARDRN